MKTAESRAALVQCRNMEINKKTCPGVEADCSGHRVGCAGAGYDASGMRRLFTVCMRAHIVALAITLLLSPNVFADKLLFRFPGEELVKAEEQKDVELINGKHGKAIRCGKDSLLRFASEGRLDRRRGTVCMWVRPDWDAAEVGKSSPVRRRPRLQNRQQLAYPLAVAYR